MFEIYYTNWRNNQWELLCTTDDFYIKQKFEDKGYLTKFVGCEV